jgi:hypothetical protein
MKTITGLTDQPKQQTGIVLNDGSRAVISLEYRANQLGWFYDITWGDFTLNGQRLVTAPNMLRQFRNKLPFGIAVVTTNNVEPLKQTDLSSGVATLYLLDSTDVADIETTVFGGF